MTIAEVTENERIAVALERIATALEQGVLEKIDKPQPGEGTHFEVLDELPRVAPLAQCPVHHQDWKYIPAGTSKKSGRPYEAFYACPVNGCTQRPPTR